MKHLCAVLFAIGIQAALGATVYTNCFQIIDGEIPHIVYSRNKGVNFAIDDYGPRGWRVTVHHERGWGYIAEGKVGDAVNSNLFSTKSYSISGEGDIFRAVFRWWYPNEQEPIISHYGWFTLGTDEYGELKILACEVSDDEYDTVVGRNEPGLEPAVDPVVTSSSGAILRACEEDALLKMMGSQIGTQARNIYVRSDWEKRDVDGDNDPPIQPDDAPDICIRLGISPIDIYAPGDNATLTYRIPKLLISKIDPTAHTVTGRIIPAAGTRIIYSPQSYAFGFNHIAHFGSDKSSTKELGKFWPYDKLESPIKLDLTGYTKTGEFTFTYEPARLYIPGAPTAIFQLVIGDYYVNHD